MDKKQAQVLIKETFESPFDKNRFVDFVKNLLNRVENAPFVYRGNFIPDAYEQYIVSYERIGKYKDGDNRIDILVVKLNRETSIERARTMQRNFVAGYLQGKYGSTTEKEAALVAFVAPNEEDWRFSLVKMDYRFEEGKKGRMRVREEFTQARRWSFLVGINENSHTAQSQLVDLVADDERNPTIAQLEESFNIEKVTKEFFEKYRGLFLWTKETLDDTVKKDKKIREDFEAKGVDAVDFSKKLLGQIVFLYFLQKKGWFGVKRDADWGTGPKNFLRELFEGKHGSYKNFFNDILEPLFYEALARERDDDFYSHFNCKIPFLNGGLFDPINNYDWVHTDILLPNDLFSNNYKTKEGDKGNGILDIFDRYNFTVKEDEPLEKEVAVDPEMLGKVFENLLEVKDRKSKGTYYTPREIVHYMCVQSLLNYLATELEGKVSKEDCEKLIKYGEGVRENEAWVEEKGEETQRYYYKLSESVRANAKLIDEKLISIKVCDPAIGSGAFPVGMMTEIVRIRKTLSSYIKGSGRTLYNFKWDCIHNSLYGVDIDPSAVEIAKLRLWLSLVVDEEDIRQIKPLPNLDYKIMQGNSLLEEYEGVRLFDDKLISTVNFDKEKQISALKEKQAELSSEYIRLHQANKLTRDKKQQIDEDLKKINAQLKRFEQTGKRVEENVSLFDIYSTAKKKSDELKRLHKEFFETTQKTKKDELKKQIERLEWDLIETTLREQNKISELKKLGVLRKTNVKPFFLWKLHFSEIFQEKGGFDVVIANPPYVNIYELEKKFKEYVSSNTELFPSAYMKFDLYILFYDLAFKLVNRSGIFSFISSNKWMNNSYGTKLRKRLIEQSQIRSLINFNGDVFEAAVDTNIIIAQNSFRKQSMFVREYAKEEMKNENMSTLFSSRLDFCKLDQQTFLEIDDYLFRLTLTDSKLKIIEKINRHSLILNDICFVGYGLRLVNTETGAGKDSFVADKKINKNYFPYIEGKDLGYWVIKNHKYLNYLPHKFYNAMFENLFVRERLVCLVTLSDINKLRFCYLDEHIYSNHSTVIVKNWFELKNEEYSTVATEIKSRDLDRARRFNYKFLQATLNSKITKFYVSELLYDGVHFYPNHIKQLRIPIVSEAQQKKIVDVVENILNFIGDSREVLDGARQAKVKECERQIDQMVYELYGLTKEEIKIVEGSGKEN